MITKSLNVGLNKGNRRLWLEGKALSDHDWTKGTHYSRIVSTTGNHSTIRLTKAPEAKLKVAGGPDRPVIDVAGKWLTKLLHGDVAPQPNDIKPVAEVTFDIAQITIKI